MKISVSDAVERGIVLLNHYFTNEDHFISDALGDIMCRICDEGDDLDANSVIYKEFLDLFTKFIKAELAEPVPLCYSLLCDMLGPGRELYPDKKKYPLWFLPDELMTKEQLKEWKKYLKKYNYNDPC